MVYEELKDEYEETKTLTINIEESMSAKVRRQWIDFVQSKPFSLGVEKILLIDLEHNIIGCEASEENVMNIFYGRFFSEEERKGENVVLLSEGYLGQQNADFIKNMLSKEIAVEHSMYKVIGSYNLSIIGDAFTAEEVAIPLTAYVKNGYAFERMVIVFGEKPDSEMLHYIEDHLKQTDLAYSVDLPAKYEKSAARQALEETAWSLLILAVCFISIFPLLYYWNQSNLKRLYIYYLCGCSMKKMSFLLFANTTYLYTLASVVALMIYRFFQGKFYSLAFIQKLVMNQICLLYFIVFLIIILFTKMQIQSLFGSKENFLTHTKQKGFL
ncbi:MAG: hypothetical protein NC124_09965 [Clostridium sp.]|nr:hypothetical protein [Clostridium sp.]